jgi:ribosomal protein L17
MLLDLHALEAQLSTAAAEVRFAPVREDDSTIAAERIATYLRELGDSRREFERLIEIATSGTTAIAEADRFLDEVERAAARRVESLFRAWAPRFATLRAPEMDPMVLTFPGSFRPYNDTVTKLVRTLLDCANALAERLAEEASDDASAAAWAERNPPLSGDEETIPWEELKRDLAGGTGGS